MYESLQKKVTLIDKQFTNNAKANIFVHVALCMYKRVSLEEKSRSQIAKSYKMIIFHHLNYSQMAL